MCGASIPLKDHMTSPSHPPILESARDLLVAYDTIFSDVWGVVHDGLRANPGAMRALTSFRDAGGTVILVSNAPVPPGRVAEMLDARHVSRASWNGIVSSGGLALDHIRTRGFDAVACIGPRDRDEAFFSQLTARDVPLADADAIVCTGLEHDECETVADYHPVLEQARARNLPFVCANPDLVVDVGGRLYLCAGALAEAYEAMGGDVYWAGKPNPMAFEAAHRMAEDIRLQSIDRKRVLAIGDALRTDLKAAAGVPVDALFIASGIHRPDTMNGDAIDPAKLARLFAAADAPPAIAAMAWLDW